MIRGIYNSASSMVALEKRMDVATTNLANVQTNGFKQDRTAISSFAEHLIARSTPTQEPSVLGTMSMADIPSPPETDWTQGSLQNTDRDLDLALMGPGLFTIQTPDGLRYTRDGGFTRNAQNQLTTQGGNLVLGENGPIQLLDGDIRITPDGVVSAGEIVAGRLRLVEFDDPTVLQRMGNNELAPRDPATQARAAISTSVRQGAIEASNVDVTATMTTIMEIQRAYEANQRMIQSQNDMTGRAVNEIARPSA